MLAHHSFAAEYDRDKKVKVTGTVTKFDLSNPHSWVYVDVKDADGAVASWAFETASAGALYRRGIRKDTFKPGMVITITGFGAKDNSHTADAQDVTMPDGMVMTLGTENSPG
jgi:DNA/RNA endonuclease YhcR with UshA esterase domain